MDDDQERVELQSLMNVIPDEEEVAVDAIPLATKPPIILSKEELLKRMKDHLLTNYKILLEKRYPLTPATITNMLNKKLQADHIVMKMCNYYLSFITKQLKNYNEEFEKPPPG
ncbi:hypothetical protein Tco_1053848 [Tanacetum coccineum]|uniref:Uncharacterized protein n=1 Tax=Tanacetum coccineum TaxID=301880 RepID=A0ABQ5GV20_9ASTR